MAGKTMTKRRVLVDDGVWWIVWWILAAAMLAAAIATIAVSGLILTAIWAAVTAGLLAGWLVWRESAINARAVTRTAQYPNSASDDLLKWWIRAVDVAGRTPALTHVLEHLADQSTTVDYEAVIDDLRRYTKAAKAAFPTADATELLRADIEWLHHRAEALDEIDDDDACS